MERARVLPGPWTRHVIVDAVTARLWLYNSGKMQGTMRVVVGKPTEQTPMLAGMMRYAIFNPYWNVPSDLVQRRIAPKVLRSEEHTSELQSLMRISYAVFCLKKKTNECIHKQKLATM